MFFLAFQYTSNEQHAYRENKRIKQTLKTDLSSHCSLMFQTTADSIPCLYVRCERVDAEIMFAH